MEEIGQERKLKITVYKDVKNICQDAARKIDKDIEKAAMHLIAELVWKKSQHIAIDLESFARHAKRTTINTDDVKLTLRHNEKLKNSVSTLVEEQSKKKSRKGNKDTDARIANPEEFDDIAAFQ